MKNNENLKQIEVLRRRADETLFRMAIQHLFDVGHTRFSEESVAETKVMIRRDTHKNAILTVDFQCQLMDLCLALSQLPIWDVLLYVKLYLGIKDDDIALVEKAEKALSTWTGEFKPQSWRDACADPVLREEILSEMLSQHSDDFTKDEISHAIRTVLDEEMAQR